MQHPRPQPRIDAAAADAIAEGALVVISHSGGKDSQAMMIRLLEAGVPTQQMLVVHASLGRIEWEGAEDHARVQAEAAGVPFLVARAKRTLFDMVRDRHATRPEVPSWPSSAQRQCTSDLKRGPIMREVRRYGDAHGYRVIVNCMGLRAEESPARRRRPPWRRNDAACNTRREWFDYLPIRDLSTAEVFETIKSAGQRPHHAYESGNERLSCVFCIFGSRNDLRNGAATRPELADEYMRLEEITGYSMHMSRRPLRELLAD